MLEIHSSLMLLTLLSDPETEIVYAQSSATACDAQQRYTFANSATPRRPPRRKPPPGSPGEHYAPDSDTGANAPPQPFAEHSNWYSFPLSPSILIYTIISHITVTNKYWERQI